MLQHLRLTAIHDGAFSEIVLAYRQIIGPGLAHVANSAVGSGTLPGAPRSRIAEIRRTVREGAAQALPSQLRFSDPYRDPSTSLVRRDDVGAGVGHRATSKSV